MKKTKRIIMSAIIVLIIILIIALGIMHQKKSNENDPVKKGYKLFGYAYCEEAGKHPREGGGRYDPQYVIAPLIECKICGKVESSKYNSYSQALCTECAEKTHRCDYCGKLLKDEE